MFYSFVDPIIVIAAKVSHLSYNKLAPQPYYDQSKYLIKHAFRIGRVAFDGTFRNLTGAKRRHLPLGLLRVFSRISMLPLRYGQLISDSYPPITFLRGLPSQVNL